MGYYHRHYRTHFFENGKEINNDEYFNSLSLTAQYSPVKNLQLMAVLPFAFNRQTGPEGEKKLTKPGDAVLLANYKLWDHASGKETRKLRQTWQVGGGLKFPTGHHHFHEANPGDVGNFNFQAGTGSTDLLLNTSYSIRYHNFSLGTGITYKMNGTNKSNYKFGNRFVNVTQVRYTYDIGVFSISPYIGMIYEQMKQDKQDGVTVIENRTGGNNLQSLMGVDLNSIKWALGISYSTSIKQNLAAGQIHALPGFNIHLSYSL